MPKIDLFTDPFAPHSNITRSYDQKVSNWCDKTIKRGQAYLKTNIAWRVADACLGILLGVQNDGEILGQSDASVNKNRRMLREGIANKANIRPTWAYKTFDSDEKVQQDCKTLGNLLESWWFGQFADRILRGSLQFADGAGTGYLVLNIELDKNTNQFEIVPKYKSHKDVLIIQPEEDLDLQTAKAVCIRTEMSLSAARTKFKHCQEKIKADRKQPSWIWKVSEKVATSLHVRDIISGARDSNRNVETIFPTVDIWDIYIQDETINYTGESVIMGTADYLYEVPSYYDSEGKVTQIITNVKKQDSDEFETVDINLEDCKLYPNRRKIIYCSGGIISDGPSPLWGNIVPAVQFKPDDVVTQFLGLPANYDAFKLEKAANSILRAWVDSINGKLSPPMAVDSSIPRNIAKKFNMRLSTGQKFRYNAMRLAKAFVPLVNPDYYNFDARGIELLNMLWQQQDYLTGTFDVNTLAKKNQAPASDSTESLITAISPLATDQSRNIEFSLLKLGIIWKPLAFQTYNYQKRLQILGKDRTKLEEIDYDPDSLVPKQDLNDPRPRWQRARDYMNKFYFYAAPNSLHERESITNQLKLFQMKKLQIPVTDKLIYTTMTGRTDYELMETEFFQQELRKAMAAAQIQASIQQIMQQIQMANNPMAALMAMGAANQNGNNGNQPMPFQKTSVGRPSDFEKAPQMQTKPDEDGIPRGTVTSS